MNPQTFLSPLSEPRCVEFFHPEHSRMNSLWKINIEPFHMNFQFSTPIASFHSSTWKRTEYNTQKRVLQWFPRRWPKMVFCTLHFCFSLSQPRRKSSFAEACANIWRNKSYGRKGYFWVHFLFPSTPSQFKLFYFIFTRKTSLTDLIDWFCNQFSFLSQHKFRSFFASERKLLRNWIRSQLLWLVNFALGTRFSWRE